MPAALSSQWAYDRIKRYLRTDVVRGFPSRSRRLISEHRKRRKALDRKVSDQSRRGLDWTNFFVADVQVSFGAFLAYYLATLSWSKQDVGLVLAVGGLVGVAAQIPGGAFVDAIPWKRSLVAAGVLMISTAALVLALWPTYPLVFLAAVLHGVTAGFLGPAIASISLGLTGPQGMSLRTGRNFRFAGAGNAMTAAVMGVLAAYVSNKAIFLTSTLLCIPTLIALSRIRSDEIDYARARNAAKRDQSLNLQRIADLAKNRNLLVFTGCIFSFQFFNTSLLPVAGQNLGHSTDGLSPLYMAGMLVVPQITVAVLAPWIGYWSELRGRKILLLAGFAVAILRALLFAITADPRVMLAIQILDGVTGAIITVLTILVLTDLTRGSGRFNLAQGIFGTLTGVSAALSAGLFGFAAQWFGDAVAFLLMAAGIAGGMALLYLYLPETKPEKYGE
jgi:predicted MFS family arabinose efflux permease